MVLIFTCLSGVGDRLGGMRGKALNTQERAVIGSFGTEKHICFSEVREMPNTKKEELLKCFTTEGAFDQLTNATLPQLIQQLSVNSDDSYENRICLWLIREKINKEYRGGLHLPGFELFRTTFKPLLDSIRAAKQYADRQPGGSDNVKLCDSFRSVPSSEYAKILAGMLENSPETWKLQPVVPAEEPANPFDEKPSSTSDIPPSSYEEATGVSARKNATDPSTSGVQPTNYFPQQPGGISVRTALQAGAIANSARVRRDPITEMVIKFPLENVLKGDKSILESFRSHLKTLPEYYLSKGDDHMGLPDALKNFLKPLGYRAIVTPGFGNCAFDAVLLSLLHEMGIYRPEYNSVLGTYLEKQMPKFRSEVAKDVKDMSLSKEIATINHPVDNEVFSVLAFKFNRKILLVTPYSKSEVIIQCYLPQGMVISPNGQTNEAFFDSLKKDALLISFNGVNHYVALMPSPQVGVVDEMVQKFSLRSIHCTRNVGDIKDFLYRLPPSCCSSQEDEDKTIPDPLKRFLDSLGYIALTVPRNNLDLWGSLWMSFCIEQGIYHPQYNRILSEFITRKAEGDQSSEYSGGLTMWAIYFKRDILLVSQDRRDEISIRCFTTTGGKKSPDHNHQTNTEFFNAFASNNAIVLIQDNKGHFTTVRQK